MDQVEGEKRRPSSEWQGVDARILGQILAAQNMLFVLPDETRIAEFYSQALGLLPGVSSCHVCLGGFLAPPGPSREGCHQCTTLRSTEGSASFLPRDFSCERASGPDLLSLSVATAEHTFGFLLFRTSSEQVFDPYLPFLSNLANYIALSLEHRIQKDLLEKARTELEDRVRDRTEELTALNVLLEEEVRDRRAAEGALSILNVELERRVKERTAELEAKNKELEKMNKLFVGRELRMMELKEKIKKLETAQAGG